MKSVSGIFAQLSDKKTYHQLSHRKAICLSMIGSRDMVPRARTREAFRLSANRAIVQSYMPIDHLARPGFKTVM